MAAPTDPEASVAERLISLVIQSTWLLWLAGGLYFAGPMMGWTLGTMAAWRLYRGGPGPGPGTGIGPGPVVYLWLGGMMVMLAALLIGHAANSLDAGQTLKSAAGWAKGWALLALFPLAGAVLAIRPVVITRAIARLGVQTLILLPLFLIAPLIGLPQRLFVSPLAVLGGSGPEYFTAVLYTLEPGSGTPRWQFFAPWSPAAGLVAVVHCLCLIGHRGRTGVAAGYAASLAIALLSQSRLALIALLLAWPVTMLVTHCRRPVLWLAASPLALAAGLFAQPLAALAAGLMDDFNGARADSSRVRATLGRIALDRWQHEAPWFGHAIVERGPHLVEYMPIGSHHSWFGLLFVKGIVGAVALAVPLFGSLILSARDCVTSRDAQRAFAMLFVLLLYSFGENLEVLGYLIWPGLLLIGTPARSNRACHAISRS
jgi:hypothetical protein